MIEEETEKNNDEISDNFVNTVDNIKIEDPDAPEILDLTKLKKKENVQINESDINNPDEVILKCVKEGSKLRVKIVTRGYYNDANCQFPKDIRKEGRMYKVNVYNVILASSKAGKYFYRVNSGISIISESEMLTVTSIKVFEDKTEKDCAVCLCVPKTTVIVPCGHFYTCMDCAKKLDRCPICRGGIQKLIDKTNMD